MSRHRLTVVLSQAQGKHPAKRALEESIVAALILEPGLDVSVVPYLYDLDANHTGRLFLESVGGATFDASLAAARRVSGRVVVFGLAGGEAKLTNWDLVYRHQVHIIGFNIGVLIQAAPQMFREIMSELFALVAAGVLSPGQPTVYSLADGAKALAALETRASVGKLALRP